MMNRPKPTQAPISGASDVRRGPDAGRQRAGQRVDDVAEQHRLDELRHRERDVGEREHAREPRLGRQQAEDAKINAQKRHDRLRSENLAAARVPGTPKAAFDPGQHVRYAKTPTPSAQSGKLKARMPAINSVLAGWSLWQTEFRRHRRWGATFHEC